MMKLPDGWKEVTLAEVCVIIMGQSPPGNSYNVTGVGMPFFQGKAEFGNKYPTVKKWTTKHSKIAKSETILMSVRAPVGDINFCDIECCIGRGLASIKPNSNIDLHYLYFYLTSIKEKIENLGTGSTFKAITGQQLKNIEIIIPPLSTQKKIVSILEKAEKAKEWRKDADALTNDFLKSVFVEMFFKEKFEISKLEKVSNKITDGKHGDCENLENSGYYFISAKDIFDGQVHYENARQIVSEGYTEVNKRVNLELGSVLITNSGSIGKIAIMEDMEKVSRTTFQKSVAIIKNKKEIITSVFLKYFLETTKEKLINTSSGSSQKNLLLKDIRDIDIPIPPIRLQQNFAAIVKQVEALKEQQKQSKEQSDNLFNALMQKAFKGDLVV